MQPRFLTSVPHDDLRRYRAPLRLRDYLTGRDLVWALFCTALCILLVIR